LLIVFQNNTMWIAALHVLFGNVYNAFLYIINYRIVSIPNLDIERMKNSVLYHYEPIQTFKIWYIVFGIAGSLFVKYLWDKMITVIKQRRMKDSDN